MRTQRFLESLSLNDGQKPCSICKAMKGPEDFHKNRAAPDGLQTACKPCARARAVRNAHKNRDRNAETRRTQRAAFLKTYGITRDSLWRRGMTLERYLGMLAEQGGACAICRTPFQPDSRVNAVCIDHDHKTNVVRGLLCNGCNTGIGLMKDDPERLANAIAYLVRNRA